MIKLIQADGKSELELLHNMRERAGEIDGKVTEIVTQIIEDVKLRGDEAVIEYTKKFDSDKIVAIQVQKDEIENTLKNADQNFVKALQKCKENIEKFHKNQVKQGFTTIDKDGAILGQRIRPLKSVGLYVPGGTAAYPSSVLMNALPAKIAGVEEIVMVTPPLKDGTANPDILVAAAIAGVDKVYLVGGAQAVSALAFGTQSIPKVDKIVGPGNIYVATAKKLLYGTVDIDMIAGPSEILVIADETANPKYLAADLMSQAEHDVLASAILVTTSNEVAKQTISELERQMNLLSRKDIIEKSLNDFGVIIVCDDIQKAYDISNQIAPEHLEIMVANPMEALGQIENAGSVFLGEYSPEALGDYYAGPNHVLPTSGTARFFSPLSVDDYIKKYSYICYNRKSLEKAKDDIMLVAKREKLTAHANSVNVRFE